MTPNNSYPRHAEIAQRGDDDDSDVRWYALEELRNKTMLRRSLERIGPEHLASIDSLSKTQLREEYLALHYKVNVLEEDLNLLMFDRENLPWQIDEDIEDNMSLYAEGNNRELLVMDHTNSIQFLAFARERIDPVTHPDDVLIGDHTDIHLSIDQAHDLALQLLKWTRRNAR